MDCRACKKRHLESPEAGPGDAEGDESDDDPMAVGNNTPRPTLRMSAAEAQELAKRLRLRALLLCTYATVWGMGGHLAGAAARTACSDFIRQV